MRRYNCRQYIERNGYYWVKGGGAQSGPRAGGGRGTGLVPEGGRAGGGGLFTDPWVVSEGGCASAVSRDLRSGAPHTHYLSTPCVLCLALR